MEVRKVRPGKNRKKIRAPWKLAGQILAVVLAFSLALGLYFRRPDNALDAVSMPVTASSPSASSGNAFPDRIAQQANCPLRNLLFFLSRFYVILAKPPKYLGRLRKALGFS